MKEFFSLRWVKWESVLGKKCQKKLIGTKVNPRHASIMSLSFVNLDSVIKATKLLARNVRPISCVKEALTLTWVLILSRNCRPKWAEITTICSPAWFIPPFPEQPFRSIFCESEKKSSLSLIVLLNPDMGTAFSL